MSCCGGCGGQEIDKEKADKQTDEQKAEQSAEQAQASNAMDVKG